MIHLYAVSSTAIFLAALISAATNDPRKSLEPSQGLQFYLRNGARILTSDLWIVLSTDKGPTDTLRRLPGISSWKIVVVGGKDFQNDWDIPGVYYLTEEEQIKLGYRITKSLPLNHHSRKNIGYLFAIQNGAKIIYDLADGVDLYNSNIEQAFDLDSDGAKKMAMVDPVAETSAVIPYIQYGQLAVQKNSHKLCAFSNNGAKPLIQNALIDVSLKVDFLCHLHDEADDELSISFDKGATSVGIPYGKFAPFTSKNTIFHRDALWGLFLPITPKPELSDLLRSFWVQAMLPDVSGFVSFLPPNAHRNESFREYFDSLSSEQSFHRNSKALLDSLLSWKSTKTHLFDRGLELMEAMAASGVADKEDVELLNLWFLDLRSAGYLPPEIIPKQTSSFCATESPATSLPSSGTVLEASALKTGESFKAVTMESLFRLQQLREHFHGIVLVLNFNHAVHVSKTYAFWTCVYSRMFSRIEYVADKPVDGFELLTYPFPKSSRKEPGYFAYRALETIVKRNPGAQGFLWTNDDLILNYWNLLGSDTDKLWFLPRKEWHVHPPQQGLFSPYPYSTASLNCEKGGWYCAAFKHFEAAFAGLPEGFKQQAMASVGVKETTLVHAFTDVFYIPQRMVSPLVEVLSVFSKKQIKSEIAIPTAFCAIANSSDFDEAVLSSFLYVWGKGRKHIRQVYSTSLSGLHPWKVSPVKNVGELVKVMSPADPTLLLL